MAEELFSCKSLFFRSILSICFAFFQFSDLFSQEKISVKLEKKQMNDEIGGVSTPLIFSKNFEDFKGLFILTEPDSTWLGKIVLDREQFWYGKAMEENPKENYFKNRIMQYKIDTTNLILSKTKSFIGVLVNLKNNKKTIIMDTNNNHDFSDDFEYIYPFKSYDNLISFQNYKEQLTQKVYFERVINKEKLLKFEFIQLIPFSIDYNFPTEIEKRISVHWKLNSYYSGKFTSGNLEWKIAANNLNSIGLLPKCNDLIFNISREDLKLNQYNWIECNQKIKLSNKLFLIDSTSSVSDEVYIQVFNTNKSDFGWNVDDFIPDKVIETNSLNLKSDKKILLVVFWGSWCGPCIKEIPELINLNMNNPNLKIISIACEKKPEGIDAAKKIVSDYGLKWDQQYQILETKNKLQNLLNVNSFPTSIVLNHTGKIIFRDSGLGNITKLKKKFNLN